MVLKWLLPAKESLKEIVDYYKEGYGINTARRIANQLKKSSKKLKRFPQMAAIEPLLKDEPIVYRSLVVTKNYKVIYYIGENTIYVYDIWDCRQNPDRLKKLSEKKK